MLSALGRALTASFRNRPVFVVGAGRSGTTVVQDALGSHPEIISSVSEAPFVCAIGSAAGGLAYGETVGYRVRTLRTPLEYTNDALRRIAFETTMGAHLGLRRVLREVLRSRKVPFGIRRWCTKTFPGPRVADGLYALYPDARFVYVFRSGCDVVHSRTRFAPMRERSFEDHCREWAESVERYEYLLSDDRAHSVRHECLTERPEEVFGGLFSFLGVSQHAGPATFATTTLVHPLDAPTEVDVAVRQRLSDRAPPYETWTQLQREKFKSLCGNAMSKLGYEIPF